MQQGEGEPEEEPIDAEDEQTEAAREERRTFPAPAAPKARPGGRRRAKGMLNQSKKEGPGFRNKEQVEEMFNKLTYRWKVATHVLLDEYREQLRPGTRRRERSRCASGNIIKKLCKPSTRRNTRASSAR